MKGISEWWEGSQDGLMIEGTEGNELLRRGWNRKAPKQDTHPRTINWPDLETRGVQGAHLFFQLLRIRKRVVAKVHVSLERERKLAVREQFRWRVFVVEPGEYRLEGVQPLVER